MGIYALVLLLPQYFLETRIGVDSPPAASAHPEFFYGFIGVAVAFQIVFLIISRDPYLERVVVTVCLLISTTATGERT